MGAVKTPKSKLSEELIKKKQRGQQTDADLSAGK